MSVILFDPPRRPWTPKRLPGLLLWASPLAGQRGGRSVALVSASAQYLSHADAAGVSIGDTDWWIFAGGVQHATTTGVQSIAAQWTSAARGWELRLESGVYRFLVGSGTSATRGTAIDTQLGTLTANTPHNLLGWHDLTNNTINLQVDALTAVSATETAAPGDSVADVRIGSCGDNHHQNGSTGVLAIGRTPTAIAALIATIAARLHNGGSCLRYSDLTAQEKTDWGLLHWLELDEYSGTRYDSHGALDCAAVAAPLSTAGTLRDRTPVDGQVIAYVEDKSGTGRHLVTIDAVATRPLYRATGFNGAGCFDFDGTDDYLTLASALALTGDFTLIWPAIVDVAAGAVFGHSSGTGSIVQTNATTLTITNDAGTALAITHTALDITAGHIYALVRSGTTITRYVDDAEDGSGTLAGTITLDRVGRAGASYLNGKLGEPLAYSVAYP